jgi:lipid-binding SYLF domain-containing protein
MKALIPYTAISIGIIGLLAVAPANLGAADDDKTSSTESALDPDLRTEIRDAAAFYTTLQEKPETSVSPWIVTHAKGILIITRWSGSVGLGVTGGRGIGLEIIDGKFTPVAFYKVAGASVGVQAGVSKTRTVAFLMSDKALRTLIEDKVVWSDNLHAIAGTHSAVESSLDSSVDVVLYQESSGLDAGAAAAGTEVAVDDDSNRKFYADPAITAAGIFANKEATASDATKSLWIALDKSAGAKESMIPKDGASAKTTMPELKPGGSFPLPQASPNIMPPGMASPPPPHTPSTESLAQPPPAAAAPSTTAPLPQPNP